MTEKVLIADDEEIIRLALADILLRTECAEAVDEARDGVEALEKARASTYDLVISDVKMPRMDGFQLLSALRDEQGRAPVIMVTAMREEGGMLNAFAGGAWDYVLKPFVLEHVVATVRRAMAAGASGRVSALRAPAGGPVDLELSTGSVAEHVDRFRDFTQLLLRATLSPDDREDIRFAVHELGMNAVEWGNRSDPGKAVRMALRLLPDRIVFEIEDEGEGFAPDAVPDPSDDHAAHEERRRLAGKRPGGYGVHIVRQLMDEVRYNEKGNAVVMTKFFR
ncbi:MAG: response regulator [Planctomycetota bacterium]|jgi:CheY-like chemotaxis protein/anti-sigma regulatory factor (Ser/Thr protein kinase)